jgi:hypothetical protein
MKTLRSKLFLLMTAALALTLMLGSTGVFAQDGDGLSEEEQAALERFEAASERVDEYDSYTATDVTTNELSFNISIMGFDAVQSERTTTTTEQTVVMVDGEPNVQANILVESVSTSELPGEPGEATSFVMEAEVRRVDGTVYVMAEYTDSEGDLPEIPEGWVEVTSAGDYAFLDNIEIEQFLNFGMDPEEDEDAMGAEEFLEFAENATDLTLEEGELEDGTAIERITLTISDEGFRTMLEEQGVTSDDPLTSAIFDSFIENAVFNITGALDGDDNLRELGADIQLTAEGFDLNEIDPEQFPEGTTMDFSFGIELFRSLDNINSEDLSPVEAPDMDM